MKSRVHPKYKTKYRVENWAEYERSLVRRGEVTIWLSPEVVGTWEPRRRGTRGGQRKYSDLAIETALTLRLVFNLPLRQAEGFLRSHFGMMGIDLSAPDHTTLSRRGHQVDVILHRAPAGEAIHLIVDSTGLSIVGKGEWAAAKHGSKGKRGWRELHIGVDGSGVIVAQVLTDGNVDDARRGLDLIHAVEDAVSVFTADAAYDTIAIYEPAESRGTRAVVPPARSAVASQRGRGSTAWDRTIRRVKEAGRRQWKKELGYHRQGTVANTFFRYKSIIGDRLRARTPGAQKSEALIACNIMNRMFEIGRPASVAIGR